MFHNRKKSFRLFFGHTSIHRHGDGACHEQIEEKSKTCEYE